MAERETGSTTESDRAANRRQLDHYPELIVKLFMLGNAGGVASAIGLIGVFLGTGKPAPIPVELLNILSWYTLGLVGGFITVVGKYISLPVEGANRPTCVGAMLRAMERSGFWISTAGYIAMSGCMIYGSLRGATFLNTLAATVP